MTTPDVIRKSRAGGVPSETECLPSECRKLASTPSTTFKKSVTLGEVSASISALVDDDEGLKVLVINYGCGKHNKSTRKRGTCFSGVYTP